MGYLHGPTLAENLLNIQTDIVPRFPYGYRAAFPIMDRPIYPQGIEQFQLSNLIVSKLSPQLARNPG
jgi:hypothetical protein